MFCLLFVYLVTLGLRYCVWAFSSCDEWGLLFLWFTSFSFSSFSRCRAQALGVWVSVVAARCFSYSAACGVFLSGPGVKLVSPALASRFLSIGGTRLSSLNTARNNFSIHLYLGVWEKWNCAIGFVESEGFGFESWSIHITPIWTETSYSASLCFT